MKYTNIALSVVIVLQIVLISLFFINNNEPVPYSQLEKELANYKESNQILSNSLDYWYTEYHYLVDQIPYPSFNTENVTFWYVDSNGEKLIPR